MTFDFRMRPWILWVLIFVLAASIGFLAWYFLYGNKQSPQTVPSVSTPTNSEEEFITITKANLGSGLKEKNNYIINDSQDWQDLWQKMNQDIFPTPALPNIDFVAKTVIIVAAGQKNTGGFDIEITNIQKQSNQTLVYYTETSPAKNCLVTMALEYPYHAIEISKTSDEITFIPQEKIKYCD